MSEFNSNLIPRSSLALVAIFTGLILLSTLTPLSTASATPPNPNGVQVEAVSAIQKFALTEWTIPSTASGPYGVGVDTSGNVWFTENRTNKIATFNPTTNDFTEWNITTPNSQPRNIFVKLVTTGNTSSTQIFFSEFGASKIARFDSTTDNLTEWTLPAGSNPAGIYVDDNNDVWFAESGRDAIGRLTPSTGNLTEWILPGATSTPGTPSLQPWSVYVQVVTLPLYSNRFVWFTETLGNKIGRLEVTSNRLTIWDLSTLGGGAYQPNDLTIGIFQTLPVAIFTNGNGKVSVLGNDTGGGSLYQETTLPTPTPGAMGLTYDKPRNAAWFAEYNAANIANLNTTNVLAGQLFTPSYCTMPPTTGSTLCASPATRQSKIIASALSIPSAVSHLVSPVSSSTVGIHQGPVGGITEYSLPSITARPTDVSVDSTGNIWFTENNVTINRIGRFSVPYLFQVSVSPSLQTIQPGQTATFSVNVTLSSGAPQPLQLSLLNTPLGVTPSFTPQTQNPPFNSILKLTTTNSTPTGTFSMTVQALSGGENQTAQITLKIQSAPPTPFDFSIKVASPTTETVTQGGSASFSVAVALLTGSPQTVNLTATGLPSGASYSFTNSSGRPTFSSTINILTSANTPGGTYFITITGTASGGTTHAATPTPTLTVTELPRDFNISTPVTQVVLVQSSRTDITLTLTSVGYFNGNVTLSGTSSPSSGLALTFTPSAVSLPTAGAIAQVDMEITAPKNTVGNYQLTVTGTSTNPSRTHHVTISLSVSPCLIATATYGSALAPQVQFLRDFRDRQIMNTFAGSNFMTAFNAWYYSFSPGVAQYESQTPAARTMARIALYPLMAILRLSESTFVAFGSTSEIGALTAGLLAGALLGLTYLALPVFCVLWLVRRRISTTVRRRVIKTAVCIFSALLVAFAISEILTLPVMMMFSSAGLVLTAIAAGSLLPALLASKLKRTT